MIMQWMVMEDAFFRLQAIVDTLQRAFAPPLLKKRLYLQDLPGHESSKNIERYRHSRKGWDKLRGLIETLPFSQLYIAKNAMPIK
jgi:hypothetical protein